jgi:hypothetical protein
MERLVMTIDVEDSWGHVWTPLKMIFWYQETITPSTQALEIENFQLQRTIEDLVESPGKVVS